MSPSDLHPEDLLDSERDGAELTPRERALLDAHLERCAACRLARELAADFSSELGHRPDDVAVLSRVIDRLAPAAAVAPAPRRRQQRWAWLAAAAALLLLTTTVAAGELWPAAKVWLGLAVEAEAPRPAPRATRGPEARPAPRRPARPSREAPAAPAPAIAPARAPASRPVARERPQAAPVAPPAALAPTAAELLVQANAERTRGNLGEAARLYRELGQLFPGSREEVTSRVSLGRLLLDGLGAPGDALRLFDSYLAAAPGGNLDEEARYGRASCLERLGRPADEAQAWESLLEHHPGSVHSSRARSRIEAIERADRRNAEP